MLQKVLSCFLTNHVFGEILSSTALYVSL